MKLKSVPGQTIGSYYQKRVNPQKNVGKNKFSKIIRTAIDIVEVKIFNTMKVIIKTSPNFIFFESEGDFCDNARALYEYMIDNNYNHTYTLIWKVSSPHKFRNRYRNNNVIFLSNGSFKDRIKLYYYLSKVKYIFFTHPYWFKQWKSDQVVFHLSHGTPIKGSPGIDRSDAFNYILCSSDETKEWNNKFWGSKPEQNLVLGAPRNDLMFEKRHVLKQLIGDKKYHKVIVCMPTFKQGLRWTDSEKVALFVIQGVSTEEELIVLNKFLFENRIFLLVKIHHLQKTEILTRKTLSNIRYIEDADLDAENIQLYHVLGESDALLTDYSSVYLDYILLNKPIGFLHEDIESYTKGRGFLLENFMDYMPGEKIKDMKGLYSFITNVRDGIDQYKIERNKVRDITNKYQDGNNRKRLIDFLKL